MQPRIAIAYLLLTSSVAAADDTAPDASAPPAEPPPAPVVATAPPPAAPPAAPALQQTDAVLAPSEAPDTSPGFALLDRFDRRNRFTLDASYLALADSDEDDVTIMRFDAHVHYVSPTTGF